MEATKVTLINPPTFFLENDASYPPSALMYIAASIEEEGCDVEIKDLSGGRGPIAEFDADIYGVTLTTPNVEEARSIIKLLKKNTDAPIVVGGTHPSFLPRETLNDLHCDAVVIGEGEIAIKEILRDFRNRNMKRIYDGGLVDLNKIAKPARHLVDLHEYSPGGEATSPVYTSRGCPYTCCFCSKISNQIYRASSVERVIEEVEDLIDYGFSYILFGDDTASINQNRLKEIFRRLKSYKIKLRVQLDVRNLDEELLELAVEAGCINISFGAESGSQKMLDLMHKQITVAQNEAAIRMCRKYDVISKAYYVVNFPGETESTIKETLDWVERVKPDQWLISNFAPLPGSETFYNPDKFGITWMSAQWDNFYLVGRGGGFRHSFSTKDLTLDKQIKLHDMLLEGFHEIYRTSSKRGEK